jgi:hypothetical protein
MRADLAVKANMPFSHVKCRRHGRNYKVKEFFAE